jgi:hypothetical protein
MLLSPVLNVFTIVHLKMPKWAEEGQPRIKGPKWFSSDIINDVINPLSMFSPPVIDVVTFFPQESLINQKLQKQY